MEKRDVCKVGQELLAAVKNGKGYEEVVNEMAAWDENELYYGLSTESQKLSFWLNCYNGYV